MDYRVYIIRNLEGRRYIGITGEVQRRLRQHNAGESKWTSRHGPWELEWLGSAMSLGKARKLENLMKRQKGGAGLATLMSRYQGS